MPATSSDLDILGIIKKSGLLSEDAIQQFEQSSPELLGNPTAIVEELTKQGLLTKFQGKFLLTGKTPTFILGAYKILEPLGKGGMGKIYLAEHTTLQRRVAIKVLPADKSKNEEILQRFYREARAAAALDHPNIVKIFDVSQGSGTHFLVMEYVHGKTLQQIVNSKGPLPYEQAVQFIIQTATGLKHAHAKGFVHRDIKPDNIIVSRQGVVKILDMGLARSLHQEQDNVTKLLNPNAIYGTVDYISPEQSIGGTVDARSDLYSLGATLFTLLTGVAPFSGTPAQVLMCHQLTDVPDLADYPISVPSQLSLIISKLMAKQPEMRYNNASELIAELQALVSKKKRSSRAATTTVAVKRETIKVPEPQQIQQVAEPLSEESKPLSQQIKPKKQSPSGFVITPKVALIFVASLFTLAVLAIVLVVMTGDSKKLTIPPYVNLPPIPNNSSLDVLESKSLCLDLKPFANVISTKSIFNPADASQGTDSLTLPNWGRTKHNGIPFELIDPKGTSVPNILVFQGGETSLSKARPASVTIPCHSPAKTIHILGGISGWAFPQNAAKTAVLNVKLRFKSGKVEEHVLLNGVHFADWRSPQADLPSAPMFVKFDKERHLRYLTIMPKNQDEIAEIVMTKGDNKNAAPIFLAITIERP